MAIMLNNYTYKRIDGYTSLCPYVIIKAYNGNIVEKIINPVRL